MNQISQRIGYSRKFVASKLSAEERQFINGRPAWRLPVTNDEIGQMRALRLDGKSARQIADELKRSTDCVRMHLTAIGLWQPRRGVERPGATTEDIKRLRALGWGMERVSLALGVSRAYVIFRLKQTKKHTMPSNVVYPDFDQSDADRWREVRVAPKAAMPHIAYRRIA